MKIKIEKEARVCDYCGEEIFNYREISNKCSFCHKDACRYHIAQVHIICHTHWQSPTNRFHANLCIDHLPTSDRDYFDMDD